MSDEDTGSRRLGERVGNEIIELLTIACLERSRLNCWD